MADQDTPSRRRRRDHSPELKRELVRQCLQPGTSVSSIAMAHGINANLVFKWRREHLEAQAAAAAPTRTSAPLLLPITLDSAAPADDASAVVTPPCGARAGTGSIELDFAGARLRLRGAVDQESLVALLTALRSLA